MFTPYELPDGLIKQIEAVLNQHWHHSLNESAFLAQAIQQQSNFYIEHPHLQTPWNQDWCQIAQLIYYMPLNLLRSQAILNRMSLIWPGPIRTICDIGCGLSPMSLLLNTLFPGQFNFVLHDQSDVPFEILQKLQLKFCRVSAKEAMRQAKDPHTLTLYSYSLTEDLPSFLHPTNCHHLLLIEPATREDGRKLMTLRSQLIEQKFNMLAPCTHQLKCPLLEHSKTDWCHDRIFFKAPTWWSQIETYLPFKNQTLTFSFLAASQSMHTQFANNTGRIIGDTLIEKGKTKQAVCYQSERTFLTWPQKLFKNPPLIERGSLFAIPNHIELKGDAKNRELKFRASE